MLTHVKFSHSEVPGILFWDDERMGSKIIKDYYHIDLIDHVNLFKVLHIIHKNSTQV